MKGGGDPRRRLFSCPLPSAAVITECIINEITSNVQSLQAALAPFFFLLSGRRDTSQQALEPVRHVLLQLSKSVHS